jgi:hypothetical protein
MVAGSKHHKTTHANVRLSSAEQLAHAVRTALMFASTGYPMALLREETYRTVVLGYTNHQATPPTVAHIKNILVVICEITRAKMKQVIDGAKAFYKGVRFIGLSADCWT